MVNFPLGDVVCVFAQQTPIQKLGANFRGEDTPINGLEVLLTLAVLAAICIALLLGSYLLRRMEQPRTINSPKRLFRDLCRLHQLDRPARNALLALARGKRIEPPGLVFLEPGCFEGLDAHAELAPQRVQLAALRDKLFN
jgi:hypothetical protein